MVVEIQRQLDREGVTIAGMKKEMAGHKDTKDQITGKNENEIKQLYIARLAKQLRMLEAYKTPFTRRDRSKTTTW